MVEEINKKDELSLEQLMLQKEVDEIAWRMLNIFRNFHVINGGIETVNKYFITADDNVIASIKNLPSGKKLAEHILNLKSGKTKMNSISEYLLPFGEDVFLDLPGGKPDIYDKEIAVKEGSPKAKDADVVEVFADYKKTELPKDVDDVLTRDKDIKKAPEQTADTQEIIEKKAAPKIDIPVFESTPAVKENTNINDLNAVIELIKNFTPAPDKLEDFKTSPTIKNIGQNWEITITETIEKSDITDKNSVLAKFRELTTYDKAVSVWSEAQEMLLNPGVIDKEDLKNRLPFFKEYLSMFGASGDKLFTEINKTLEE
jgi:hypothetical protein